MLKIPKIENRMKFIYGGFLKRPVDRNSILFESFHGKEISDSPLAMAQALQRSDEGRGFKVFFSTDNADRDRKVTEALGLDVKLVDIHSKEYALALATCGYLVNNSSFPSYFIRREGQHYMQTWHGTPLKTLGKSMPYDIQSMYNVQHNFIQADMLTFPNEFTRDVIMRDYNLTDLFTGRVIMCGYPRNSIFFDRQGDKELKNRLGDEGIETFAYMPTWRGQSNQDIDTDDYNEEVGKLLAMIDETLTDRQKLYVNFHPIVQKSIKLGNYNHIFPFPKDVEKYEFLNCVDALVTDYSSVFFDYSITGKPIILFPYDYEEYMADRSMYFDIKELPFMRTDTVEEFLEAVRTGSWKEHDYSNDADYQRRFMGYDCADAPEKLMRYLLHQDDMDLTVLDYSFNKARNLGIAEYPIISDTEELDEIARQADPENDVVVFYQHRFNKNRKLSEHMLQNYRDAFRYIFVTRSNPKSYYEAFRDRIVGDITDKLDARDQRRFLGDLNSEYKESCRNGKLLKLQTSGSRLIVKSRFPKKVGKIEKVILLFRSNIESVEYPFEYTVTEKDGFWFISSQLDLAGKTLDGTFWDYVVVVRNGYGLRNLNIGFTPAQRKKMFSRNYQCELGEYILFPHVTLKRRLAFTHREKTAYDTTWNRIREAAAARTYRLFRKNLKRRNIWLVFEKFCTMAQDNGYYFFKYCMEKLPEEEKKNIFYVMDRNAPDWDKVAVYGKNVIPYMSFRHMVYNLAAKIYVGSDSKRHLYTWRPKPNRISYAMKNKKILFLQHGVTALKKVDGIFGAHGSSPMTYFVTTSDYEQKIVTDNFGYTAEQAPVTGFTRWDVLEDKSTPDERIILVMPTWRAWLEEKTKEEFRRSDYFEQYSRFLQNEELADCLKANNVRLIFYIHPKFRDYLGEFNMNEDAVEMIPFGTVPLNEIMMKCSMLITDYSSVCWDVYYMKKPVLFFQFDYDTYMENHGSYMDMENELFGPRLTNCEDLIDAIRELIDSGFAESEDAKAKRDYYFKYIEADNSKRVYEFLKKEGY